MNNAEQKDVFENLYDPRLFELSEELKKVDEWLREPKIFKPFQEQFGTKRGRPSVPVATYLRMMYLKDRYQMGYETLVEEMQDHIKWRKFCQIPMDKQVPDSTTLIKLTQKYGPEMIEAVNQQILVNLKEQRIIKGKKLRLDSTVVESNIHYPTDVGLLADSVRTITRIVKQVKEQGHAAKIKFRDRTRSVKKVILKIAKNLRRKTQSKKESIKEHSQNLLKVTRTVIKQAADVLHATAQAAKNDIFDGIKSLHDDLKNFTDIARRVSEQTQTVLANPFLPIDSRIVSIFDTEARPIKKGKLGIPCEFGRKIYLQDTPQGIITGYEVFVGNPADDGFIEEPLKKHKEIFGEPPREIATDRGFSSRDNEEKLEQAGVQRISMPRKGKPDKERKQYQKQYWFKRLQRFRAGCEAKISLLKRKFGFGRSRLRGTRGTKIHVGWAIFTHNLWQTTRLT
jgi:IS5 family transposase